MAGSREESLYSSSFSSSRPVVQLLCASAVVGQKQVALFSDGSSSNSSVGGVQLKMVVEGVAVLSAS